jgi:hypothetical protein
MTDPIVFIVRNKIKPGRLAVFREHYLASLPQAESGKLGTIVQLAYENEDAMEVSIVRLFPGADALDAQLQGAEERSKRTYEFIEPDRIELFGTPNPATLEKMRKIAGTGIQVSLNPKFMGGFMR